MRMEYDADADEIDPVSPQGLAMPPGTVSGRRNSLSRHVDELEEALFRDIAQDVRRPPAEDVRRPPAEDPATARRRRPAPPAGLDEHVGRLARTGSASSKAVVALLAEAAGKKSSQPDPDLPEPAPAPQPVPESPTREARGHRASTLTRAAAQAHSDRETMRLRADSSWIESRPGVSWAPPARDGGASDEPRGARGARGRAAAVLACEGPRRHRALLLTVALTTVAALPSLPSVRVADATRAVARTRRRASEARRRRGGRGRGRVAERDRARAPRGATLRAAARPASAGRRAPRARQRRARRVRRARARARRQRAAARRERARGARGAACEAASRRHARARRGVRRADEAKASLRAALALAEGELHKELRPSSRSRDRRRPPAAAPPPPPPTRTTAPRAPAAAAYAVGEKVFYLEASQTAREHWQWTHGQAGIVACASEAEGMAGAGLDVMFPGNKAPIPCLPAQLGRAPPPPLPGGYALGETVVYVAEDFTFASGNRLAHGAAGEVMGPTAVGHVAGKGLSVLFPGNRATVACELADLRRAEDARDHRRRRTRRDEGRSAFAGRAAAAARARARARRRRQAIAARRLVVAEVSEEGGAADRAARLLLAEVQVAIARTRSRALSPPPRATRKYTGANAGSVVVMSSRK